MARRQPCLKSRPCSRNRFRLTASPSTLASSMPRRLAGVTAWKTSRSVISISLGRAGSQFAVFRRACQVLYAFLEDTPPLVFGDGEQTRDFTYVENAVQANLLACEAPNASGKVFNVGVGERISLNEVPSRAWKNYRQETRGESTSRPVMETSATPRRTSLSAGMS